MDQLFYSRFGGGGDTNVTLLGLVFTAVAILLIFVLPRKYVLLPILLVSFLMTMGEVIVIGGLHFMMIRVIVIFAWARVFFGYMTGKRDDYKFQMNTIDKAFVYWAISGAVIYSLLWRESDAVVNRMGVLYNAFGIYFLFRCFCRDEEDVDRLVSFLSLIAVVLAACMVNEQLTGRNLFSVLGGVPAFTLIREGKLRSQATFGNAILAGNFGATLFPLFLGQCWYRGKSRLLAAMGIVSAIIIALTSASATPLMALAAAIMGFFLWPFRRKMKLIRGAVVSVLVGLHLVMKAPVWALIARVDIVGGSSGYQREVLVDAFIRHFWDWFLIGSRNYANWGWFTQDLANQFVYEGVNGGLLTFVCFLAIIVYAFKFVGKARKMVEDKNRKSERRLWTLGVAIFAHMAAFMGISYFDSSIVGWFALLAMISAATMTVIAPVVAEQQLDFAPAGGKVVLRPLLAGNENTKLLLPYARSKRN